MHALIVSRVAFVLCTAYAVATIRRITTNTAVDWIAGFHTIAEQAIIAESVLGQVDASVVAFVASILRASHSIIAVRRRPVSAESVKADLSPVTEQSVVALGIVITLRAGNPLTRRGIPLV